MHSETQRARFIIWIFIFLSLAVGAGAYWFSMGKYQGQAAKKINASKETVMTNTLVGYWTLDGSNIVWGDTTSEIKDVNPGTKHHGNSTNLAAGSAVPGRTGQGLLFNGSSDTVSLGNVYNGVKTVAFWVKPNTTTQSLIDLNAAATVDINAGTVRGNNFTTPTIYVDGVATTTFPDTEWHHIAVTTGTGVNASAAYIGQIASSYFGGTIDDIRFYSDALTATQVADLYRASGAKEISNANHREALTNGLVGYWTFDGRDVKWSDANEIKDISGNGNHGDVSGLTRTSVTPGKLGQGLSFNGTGDYVDLNSGIIGTGTYTFCTWIKAPSFSGFQPVGNAYPFWFGVQSVGVSGQIWAFISNNDTGTMPQSGYFSENVWNHICAIRNSNNTATFYVNSIQSGTANQAAGTISPVLTNFLLAKQNGGSNYYTGLLDDFRVYDRALSTTEIANLYNVGK